MTAICDGLYQTVVDVLGLGSVSLQSLNALQFNTPVVGIDYDPNSRHPIVLLGETSPAMYDAVIVATTTWAMEFMGMTMPGRATNLPDITTEPMNGEVFNIVWQSEPYYYDAFKLNFPGQEPALQAAYYQFFDVMNPATDKGIYLAGDGVSCSGGWTEGALQTAINCATAVAYRLKGKLPSYNALVGQNPQLYDYGS